MSRTTYFESLTDDTMRIVVRHVSKHPRHPTWYRFMESENFFALIETGGLLEISVINLFDGLSTKPSPTSANGLINEDRLIWLHLSTPQTLQHLNLHLHKLKIRSLELTREVASSITSQLLSVIALTVTSLCLKDFGYDEHAGDVNRIMSHLGRNLVEFRSNDTNRSIVWAVREYCTKLSTLRLIHIGGLNRVPVSLASVGDWTHLGDTLQCLTLIYLFGGCEEDALMVQNSFPNLRKLSVEFGTNVDTSANPDAFVNYFRGIEKKQLEYSDFSLLPYSNIVAMREKYPNALLDAVITGQDTCAQLVACGESLRIATVLAKRANKKMVETAAEKCTSIEKLIIPLPLRLPMRSLHTLNLTWGRNQDPEFLNYLANNSGMLEVLTIRGESPNVNVWAKVAHANRRLRRVRLVLQSSTNDVPKLVAILEAFVQCPGLHEVTVKFLPQVRTDAELTNADSVRNALVPFRVRTTHICIGNVVCLA